MKRLRLAVPVLLAALFAALTPKLGPARAETSYFLVVNDRVYPFEQYSRPLPPSNHGTMVPHTVLTDANNGLRLRFQWSPEEKHLTLFNNDTRLTFVSGQHTAFSGSDRYTAPLYPVSENPLIFLLPAELVCDVFGFGFSNTSETEWGTMVRVTSGNAMSDDWFIRYRGELLIKPRYDEYMASIAPPSPTPGVSAPPGPAGPSPSPPPPPPSPSPSPEVRFDVSVYLTFDGAVNESTERLLDFIEREGLPALFFLPPESLLENPAAVRRMTARHQVGLLINETEEETDAVPRANALLREAAFVKTWLLRSDSPPPEPSGYRYWGYSHRFAEDASAQDLINAVTPLLERTPDPTVLVFSLPHTDAVTDALAELLPLMGRDNIYRINPGEPAR
ncbi:MAG: polysaccharide deacetylase family protein [Oscillospiraceae bacterium]|nr:polysaccharide deacetylase family protein [Oscillospiraceae bacterium]